MSASELEWLPEGQSVPVFSMLDHTACVYIFVYLSASVSVTPPSRLFCHTCTLQLVFICNTVFIFQATVYENPGTLYATMQ